MKKHLAGLLTLTMGMGLVGCGDQARQQSAVEQAVNELASAQRGFVPRKEGQDPVALEAHRQEALREAGQALDDVIAQGTTAQKAGAHRLRADVNLSAARYAAQQAAAEYAELAPRAVRTLTYALAARRAQARGQGVGVNQPQVIQELEQAAQQQKQQQQTLQSQAAELQKQVEALQAELAQIQARRDEAIGKVGALREQAFVAEGEERFTLEEEAATQLRQSTLASAEADRKQLEIDMVNSRLAIVNSQLELATSLLEGMQARVEAAQQRQQQVESDRAEAQAAQDEALATLTQEYEQLVSVFDQAVDRPLRTAAEQSAQAIEHLRSALDLAQDGGRRQALQTDLTTALTLRSQILLDHMLTLDGFADILALYNTGDSVAGVSERIAQLRQEQERLASQATQAIEAGREAASGLGGAAAEFAQAKTSRLDTYAQQLAQLRTN